MRNITTQPAVLRNVTKRYGAVTALDSLNLTIRRGEVLALLGPNGAGKTTAVNLLLGLARPDSGEVRLFGLPPNDLAARRRAGAMLQISGVPATLKVREHLELFRSYYSAPLYLAETLEAAGLGGLENRTVGKLSGGQQQRLMFALAICGDPEILFLDEPTTGLDVEARRALWTVIRRMAGSGRTVVLTTHYLEEADALAGRIVLINHGRVIAEGSPAEIKARTAARRVRCRTTLTNTQLGELPAATETQRDGEQMEILTPHAELVVQQLLQLDPALRELEVTGTGLEDAFLALTRGSRSEQEAA